MRLRNTTGSKCDGRSFIPVYHLFRTEFKLDGDGLANCIVQLDLPLPPSVNHMYQYGRKRVFHSKQYKVWIHEAKRAEMVQECRPPKNRCDTKKVRICFEVYPGKGFRWNRDGSNMIKALEDWLVANGYVKDDSFQFVRETKVCLADHTVAQSFVRVTVTQ